MSFFTTFTAISLSLNLCFNGHGYIHNVKPYINKRTVCRKTILASLTEIKKFNSLVVAHLSPDVFHLGTELHTQVERVLNSGWDDYGKNSLLITAVTICTFPSQSPVLPRSVLGHRAGKQFMYHWNIDVICRKINDTTWIQISLTNNTSRAIQKGWLYIQYDQIQTFDDWAMFWHDMTKSSGWQREADPLSAPKRLQIIFGYSFKLHFAAFF